MEFILLFFGIVGFIYLKSRISVLEQKITTLEGGKVPPVSVAPTETPEIQVSPVIEAQPIVPEPQELRGSPEEAAFDEESGGRWLGRLGIAAIFIGIAFFLKYAFDTNLIGITGRILLGVLAGGIFVASGQYLRKKYAQYAYLLVGGGIAILYVSFYTAFALYHLVSQPVAFGLMSLVTLGAIALSLYDNSGPLAILAVLGGFATPYLIASGQNDPVSLFLYILILDTVVLALATRKKWVELNYISFIGTQLQYLSWYGVYYTAAQMSVGLLFAGLFLALFVGVAVMSSSELLAAFALVGGFVATGLISWVHNDALTIFTCVAVVDVAVVAIAAKKNWPKLTYVSFIGSVLLYGMWHNMYYSADQLLLAVRFLTLFFLIYLTPPVIRNGICAEKAQRADLLLVTLNAFGYFSILYFILNPAHHDLLWVAAIMLSCVYYGLAFLTHDRNREDIWFAQYYAGIATLFVTIAVPLKLDHSWITLAWLGEAALLYIIGFKNKYTSVIYFAAGVYAVGVCKLFIDCVSSDTLQTSPIVNEYVGLFFLAVSVAYLVSYLYHTHPVEGKDTDAPAAMFFVIANILSVYILTAQISAIYDARLSGNDQWYFDSDLTNQKNMVISIAWSVYSVLLVVIGFGAKLRLARVLGLIFFFITACWIFLEIWSFGEIYRIVASIVFGAVALLSSFLYVKYSKRIKEIIYQ
jgi:uncharacterized membrane protein